MNTLAAVVLLFAADSKAEDALSGVAVKHAAESGKKDKSIEAIEKAIRQQPCPRCEKCDAPRALPAPPQLDEPSVVVPPPAQIAPAQPRIPWWVWAIVAGAAAGAFATGVGVGLAAAPR